MIPPLLVRIHEKGGHNSPYQPYSCLQKFLHSKPPAERHGSRSGCKGPWIHAVPWLKTITSLGWELAQKSVDVAIRGCGKIRVGVSSELRISSEFLRHLCTAGYQGLCLFRGRLLP